MVLGFILLQRTGDFSLFARIQNGVEFIDSTDADIHIHRDLRHIILDVGAHLVQALFDIPHIRNDDKMIVRKTGNQIIRELFLEACGKMDQEFIAPVKTICAIVKFHPDNIKEDNRRVATLAPDTVRKVFTADAAIFHIRKPRQRIKVTVRLFANAEEHGVFLVPLDKGRPKNQVAARTGVRQNFFALFKDIVNGKRMGNIRLEEEFFKIDARLELFRRNPDFFNRRADHVNFMRLRIDNDKRIHQVRIQKFRKIVRTVRTFFVNGLDSLGHIIIIDDRIFGAILQVTMVSRGMECVVIVFSVKFLPIVNIVVSTMCFGKILGLGNNIHKVFTMDILVHIRIEIVNHLFTGKTGPL